ncbi:MAG TPA: ion channel [Actinomycetota bacterium]|nr:ion channel [Actinomycetota bacterium]
MRWLATLGGTVIVLVVLWDAFETILLPRRVTRRLRLSTLFQKMLWHLWSGVARRIRDARRREGYLATYAVLALIALVGLWAAGLVVGFALIQSGAGTRISPAPGAGGGFAQALYLSGSSLFTLGIGDTVPLTAWGRVVTVVEAGVGLGFVAVLLAYLPVLYQSFSRREVRLSMLDEIAGSPPRAGEMLRRAAARERGGEARAVDFFRDWELWSAEILESHLSYPLLGYFRSQHDNQSWLAAMTAILDVSAMFVAGSVGQPQIYARRTFAMARHAVVDLTQVYGLRPSADGTPRVRTEHLDEMRGLFAEGALTLRDPDEATMLLDDLVRGYQSYVEALAEHLLMPLPPVAAPQEPEDNWQRSPWEIFRPERRTRR